LYSPNNKTLLVLGPDGVVLTSEGEFTQKVKAGSWWSDGNNWTGTGGSYGMLTTGTMVMFTVGLNLETVIGGDVSLKFGPVMELGVAAEFKLNYARGTEIKFGVSYEISYEKKYEFKGGGQDKLFPSTKSLGEKVNIWHTVREIVAEEETKKIAQQSLLATSMDTTAGSVTVTVAGEHDDRATGSRSILASQILLAGGESPILSIGPADIIIDAPEIIATAPIIQLN
jgi:hypothetical protein